MEELINYSVKCQGVERNSSSHQPCFQDQYVCAGCGTNNSYNYSNTTSYSGMGGHIGPPAYLYAYVTVASCIIFLAGVIGNLLVILVVVRMRSMRTRMNFFLVNLSVADLMVLIVCQPVALLDLYAKERWLLGGFMCKLVPFLENAAIHCSVLSLLVVSQERFVAIYRPLSVMTRRWIRRRVPAILFIWVLSLSISMPFTFISIHEEVQYYDDSWQWKCRTKTDQVIMQVFLVADFVLFMILPLIAITYFFTAILWTMSSHRLPSSGIHLSGEDCYRRCRIRERVVKMMVAVVVLFYACVLPLRCLAIWLVFISSETLESIGFQCYLNLLNVARLLMFVNSAVNPVIYGLMCTKFRNAFASVLPEQCARHVSNRTSGSSLAKLQVFNGHSNSKCVRTSQGEYSISGVKGRSAAQV